MNDEMRRTFTLAAGLLVMVGMVACGGNVEEEVFNEEVSDIRSQVEENRSRIDQNSSNIEDLQNRVGSVENDLEQMRNDFQAQITELEEGLRFAMPVHFEFDQAEIRSVDRPVLDRFASVASEHYSDATITVEGFADPAGSASYNRQLSQARAQAVADYLTSEAGLSGEQVRTVGYGEDRLVRPNEAGPGREGLENRRVTFVIEYAGGTEGGGMSMDGEG